MRGNAGRRIGRLVAAASIGVGVALLVGAMAGNVSTPNDANWVHADANWVNTVPSTPNTIRVEADANWVHAATPYGTDDANWVHLVNPGSL